MNNPPPEKDIQKRKVIATISATLPDGRLAEMVCDREEGRSGFAVWQDGAWKLQTSIDTSPGDRLVPYSSDNNLIKNEVVLLPSGPQEYDSEEQLLADVRSFIHRYVDVSPLFEKLASYYVLFSWVYDGFNELPYLRLRGDYGSGKTRCLLIIGSLCYKPMFASGASTVSPLFRIMDAFRGTLIMDEADFRFSDEQSELVKILNNGNARGFPVLRSEVSGKGEYNPRAYAVFGPKLVATREYFQDRALESRCLTEEMGQTRLREDIPLNLPASCKKEALHIRNQLLMFRFRSSLKPRSVGEIVDRSIEPRLNQVFAPLLSIIDDPRTRDDLRELARRYQRDIVVERGMDTEAQLLGVVRDLVAGEQRLEVKEITNLFADRHGADYERKVTPRWIGGVLRKKLNLRTQKSHGVFVIADSEGPKLERLYEKYGLTSDDDASSRTGASECHQPIA